MVVNYKNQLIPLIVFDKATRQLLKTSALALSGHFETHKASLQSWIEGLVCVVQVMQKPRGVSASGFGRDVVVEWVREFEVRNMGWHCKSENGRNNFVSAYGSGVGYNVEMDVKRGKVEMRHLRDLNGQDLSIDAVAFRQTYKKVKLVNESQKTC